MPTPAKDPEATKYDTLDYFDVLKEGLGVMDSTATSLCMDNNIPIIVFNFDETDNIVRAVLGEKVGTIVGGNLQDD